MQEISNKVALVTGGSSGIGKAIVGKFLEKGMRVVCIGSKQATIEKTLEEYRSHVEKGNLLGFYGDVSKKSDVEEIFSGIEQKGYVVDVLVNCAGITEDVLLMKMSEEQWDRVIDVNLKSVYFFSARCIRSMMKARRGKIINIGSVIGIIGNAGQANYAAAKAGMIGFTKSLAKEVGSRGICVNCIAPGFIETPMTAILPDMTKTKLREGIPLGRFGLPEEVAALAFFLASDAAEYITGQVIAVDGGMTA